MCYGVMKMRQGSDGQGDADGRGVAPRSQRLSELLDADHGPGGMARAHRPAADGRQGPDGGPAVAVPHGGCTLAPVAACHLGDSGASDGGPAVPGGRPEHPRAARIVEAVDAYLAGRHSRKSRMLGVKQVANASKTQRAGAERGLFPKDLAECSSPERVTWPPGAAVRRQEGADRPPCCGKTAGAGRAAGGRATDGAAADGLAVDAAGQRAAQGSARTDALHPPWGAGGESEECRESCFPVLDFSVSERINFRA